MTTSDRPAGTAYVWVWLPGASDPVVAGRLDVVGDMHEFTYGRSYLERTDAISLYTPELPLKRGTQRPGWGMTLAGCLADAGPDAWGRRVILARLAGGHLTSTADVGALSTLTYLLESGSDRIGALDFQLSATEYAPREHTSVSLAELLGAADALQQGKRLPEALALALVRGTSVGGARPKALIEDGDRSLIAKFSSTTDPYPVVKAEAVAMELARRAGVNTAPTELVHVAGRDVLLVERFDRTQQGHRRALVSAATMQHLEDVAVRHATYTQLADDIRHTFAAPDETLRELFTRIAVNIAVGNTDDHARNHAAFWDGRQLTLTPAYDVCPQLRGGGETNQAMAYGPNGGRRSRFADLVAAASTYHLSRTQGTEIVEHVRAVIHGHWKDAADTAQLTEADRDLLWRQLILHESTEYDWSSATA